MDVVADEWLISLFVNCCETKIRFSVPVSNFIGLQMMKFYNE